MKKYWLVVQRSTSRYYYGERWEFAKLYESQKHAENWVDIQLNAERNKEVEYQVVSVVLPEIPTQDKTSA